MTATERLKQFADYKGINNATFEKLLGMSNGSFAKNLKSNGNLSLDKLEICLNEFPELNAEWLLTGKGGMFKSSTVNEPELKYGNTQFNDETKQFIDSLKDIIKDKDKIIALYEEKLKDIKTEKSN